MPLRRVPARRLLACLAALAGFTHGAELPAYAQPDANTGTGVSPLVPILLLVIAVALLAGRYLAATDHPWLREVLLGAAFLMVLAAGVSLGIWWTGGAPAATAEWGLLHFLLLGLAAVSLVFLAMFLVESRRHAVALESHWGGFGGGLGGLRLPAAGLYLVAALGFGAMLTVLSVRYLAIQEKGGETSGQERPDTSAGDTASLPAAAAPDTTAGSAAPADTVPADTTRP